MAFTHFNNTVVMGSFLCGLVLYVPFYFAGRGIVYLWRKYAASYLKNSKLMKVINKMPVVAKIASLAGGN